MELIEGNQILLRRLAIDDVSERYVRWLNDPRINQYLECRFMRHTVDETKQFVHSISNESNYLFGIFEKITGDHIGNIKIGNINIHHKSADIGFIIGEKKYWGRGIATEAIALATDFAFRTLHLHKIWGGTYAPNVGSMRAFEKNGYVQEGCKKSQFLCNGVYVDAYIYGKVNTKE